jgi:hypothetical protein
MSISYVNMGASGYADRALRGFRHAKHKIPCLAWILCLARPLKELPFLRAPPIPCARTVRRSRERTAVASRPTSATFCGPTTKNTDSYQHALPSNPGDLRNFLIYHRMQRINAAHSHTPLPSALSVFFRYCPPRPQAAPPDLFVRFN